VYLPVKKRSTSVLFPGPVPRAPVAVRVYFVGVDSVVWAAGRTENTLGVDRLIDRSNPSVRTFGPEQHDAKRPCLPTSIG